MSMRTFRVHASVEATLIVPEHFVQNMRSFARVGSPNNAFDESKPESAENLRFIRSETFERFHARYPDDDEAFIRAVVAHGIRYNIREDLLTAMAKGGIGGRVAPVSISTSTPQRIEIIQPEPHVKPVQLSRYDPAVPV